MKPPSQQNISPTLAQLDALLQRGTALHRQGQLAQAWDIYKQILSIHSKHFDALHMAGLVAAQANNSALALQLIGKAIEVNPNSADAYGNRGNVLIQLGQYQAALDNFDKANQLRPGLAETYANRGNALKGLKEWQMALESYDRAIQLKPNFAGAHSNRGTVLMEQKQFLLALESFEYALKLQSNLVEAHFNSGAVLMQMGRYQAAIQAFEKALPRSQNKAEVFLSRGVSLLNINRRQEAIKDFEKVIELDPNNVDAYSLLGTALYDLQHYQAAYESYAKAYSLNPDTPFLHGTMMRSKMFTCNWQDQESDYIKLREGLTQSKKVAPPLVVMSLVDSPMLQKSAAELFIQHNFPENAELGKVSRKNNEGKICIGYYSSDFRNHPVAYLVAELFESHDREKFTLIAFSFGQDPMDEMRHRISAAFDQFIDVNTKSDREVAELSRELGVDIAVDLNGLTKGARTNIFALRAAPIQIGYIGYLGTTGATYMDYVVADKTTIPDSTQSFYTEKIVYLPSYQANDSKSRHFDKKLSRNDLGLSESSFVFCCFNSNYKITPLIFDSWMRILRACENSVLLISADTPSVKDNLKREAIARGVDGERLVFGDRLSRPMYLARYDVADLFLDTWPYNAGTTASDALWVGLPILTLAGQSFASRIASSILTAIDLPELITHTPEQYEMLAIQLATNKYKLDDIKKRLAANRLTKRLFNTRLFTNSLELAYIEMIQRYQSDLPPDHIYISE